MKNVSATVDDFSLARAVPFAIAIAIALLSCSSVERAPLTGDCAGTAPICQVHPFVGIATGVGPAADAGSPNGPSNSGPGVVLTGQVFLLGSGFSRARLPYGGGAFLKADGASGVPVTATSSGFGDYRLSEVKSETSNWLDTRAPTAKADVVATLQAIDTSLQHSADGLLASGFVLDQIFAQLSPLPVRDPNAGQAVVHFISVSTGQPLDGLTLSVPKAKTVAYGDHGAWTNAPDVATDSSGVAAFVNVSASATPADVAIVVNGGAQATLLVRVASGTVTFQTFRL